jgi:hypothetical protein
MGNGTEASIIDELRTMKIDAKRLSSSILKHLKPFQKEDASFKTLPDSGDVSRDPGISVGSTCTVLMALLGSNKHADIPLEKPKRPEDANGNIAGLFSDVVTSKWGSSGLQDGNAFTTALVVRTAGFIVEARILKSEQVLQLKHKKYKDEDGSVDQTVADKTLREIVKAKASAGEISFRVSGYPAKTTIGYWFVDGAIKTGVAVRKQSWAKIASWAAQQFHQQLIYVSAGNDSLMDPPELAMAACLIQRIHRLCSAKPELAEISRTLPSTIELAFAVERVLREQPASGIWHKYFPLFHFPKGGGAADYCFSFEFLEAVLIEFGSSVLRKGELLEHFKLALSWCDRHVLHYVKSDGDEYRGWNSGGEVRKLAAGMPEAWATASVHMFLNQLHRKTDEILDELILKRFGLDRVAAVQSTEKFDSLIDVNISFPNEPNTTLLTVLKEELIANADDWAGGRKPCLEVPRSALLFGPPGTSKTNLAKSIALSLGWPIVIITPSEFLGKGLEQVHAQVDERFRDLMDLRQVVVFFDEMDALAQTREEPLDDEQKESLDVTRELLTTSMLPKLADLWDKKQVVFLMATNHKQQLDPAITRANRFDLLLCVAPPPWSRKRLARNLTGILGVTTADQVEVELRRLVRGGSDTERSLDLFTVSEVGIFFDHLRRIKGTEKLLTALRKFKDGSEFSRMVVGWAQSGIALRDTEPTRKEYDKDRQESRRQYYREEKTGGKPASKGKIVKGVFKQKGAAPAQIRDKSRRRNS